METHRLESSAYITVNNEHLHEISMSSALLMQAFCIEGENEPSGLWSHFLRLTVMSKQTYNCFLVQGMLVPQLPAGEAQAPVESEAPEEALERLAHLEQLVVQLKELIRDKDTLLVQKDTELANKDAQLKVNNPLLNVCVYRMCHHLL